MQTQEEIKELVDELRKMGLSGKPGQPGDPFHVKIWIRDGFHCVYCDADLLADRIRLYSAQLDHLLPKEKYKEYIKSEDNLVLSCFCCNQIKGRFDPMSECDEDVKQGISSGNLRDHRQKLIDICLEKKIKESLEKLDRTATESRLVVLSRFRSKPSSDFPRHF